MEQQQQKQLVLRRQWLALRPSSCWYETVPLREGQELDLIARGCSLQYAVGALYRQTGQSPNSHPGIDNPNILTVPFFPRLSTSLILESEQCILLTGCHEYDAEQK